MSAVIGSKKINFSEEQGMLLDVAREFVKDKSPGQRSAKVSRERTGVFRAGLAGVGRFGLDGHQPSGIGGWLRVGYRGTDTRC